MYTALYTSTGIFLKTLGLATPPPSPSPLKELGSEKRQRQCSDRDSKWLNMLRFAYHKQMSFVRVGFCFVYEMTSQVLQSVRHKS